MWWIIISCNFRGWLRLDLWPSTYREDQNMSQHKWCFLKFCIANTRSQRSPECVLPFTKMPTVSVCSPDFCLFWVSFLSFSYYHCPTLYSDHISVSSSMLLFCLLDILSQFQSTTMPLNLVRGMHSVLLWGVKMWGLNPLLADMPSVFFQYLWHCSLVRSGYQYYLFKFMFYKAWLLH